jgi:hypothetical protein
MRALTGEPFKELASSWQVHSNKPPLVKIKSCSNMTTCVVFQISNLFWSSLFPFPSLLLRFVVPQCACVCVRCLCFALLLPELELSLWVYEWMKRQRTCLSTSPGGTLEPPSFVRSFVDERENKSLVFTRSATSTGSDVFSANRRSLLVCIRKNLSHHPWRWWCGWMLYVVQLRDGLVGRKDRGNKREWVHVKWPSTLHFGWSIGSSRIP